ncbi:MAG: hypothetical protein DRJ31_04200 [Candidatus Methanomethylicota archaeon]|uniref:ECF transporter S component n=1 Tax=Thermoproteota archaeon TaxID=2056631 RepID=A0A497ERF1_9CREN|nr:MAG: hypothetical protein DRJ31_04200 [Candidatus Verstraetearchaeota archaeon]
MLVALAALLALSVVFELLPKVRAPWGMSIDFVAVPILIAFFVFGFKEALALSAGLWVLLCIMGFGSFIGGTMKVMATLPMFAIPAILAHLMKRREVIFSLWFTAIAFPLALLVRCAVAVVLNYYWAIPLFFGEPIEVLIEKFFFGSIWGFIWFVSAMNITQGVVDYLIGLAVSSRIVKLKILE